MTFSLGSMHYPASQRIDHRQYAGEKHHRGIQGQNENRAKQDHHQQAGFDAESGRYQASQTADDKRQPTQCGRLI